MGKRIRDGVNIMTEIIKETVTTSENNAAPVVNSSEKKASSSQTIEYLIYFLFGILEVLLVFRLIFRLTGASMSSRFVEIIYSLTALFILPFEGIFRPAVARGVETTAILEPSTLVAIVVYAVVAIGIVKLTIILSGKAQTS